MHLPFDLLAPLSLVLLQAAPAQTVATTINAAGALAFFNAILTLAQTVGLPAFGVSAAWAGYQLMFSTSPRHQDGAKEQLKWSVIGLVIILAANQLADIVKPAAGATGSGG
jgi:4-amino-4-deoxy-L-arabinose transferase-like glycosyltransferase